jgi:hypothetical protein
MRRFQTIWNLVRRKPFGNRRVCEERTPQVFEIPNIWYLQAGLNRPKWSGDAGCLQRPTPPNQTSNRTAEYGYQHYTTSIILRLLEGRTVSLAQYLFPRGNPRPPRAFVYDGSELVEVIDLNPADLPRVHGILDHFESLAR